MFTAGELVVCVDDRFTAEAYERCPQLPRWGEVYTVRAVTARARDEWGNFGTALRVVECVNPNLPPPLVGEPWFATWRFKALGIAEHQRCVASERVREPAKAS